MSKKNSLKRRQNTAGSMVSVRSDGERKCAYALQGCLGKAKEYYAACESCLRLLSKSKRKERVKETHRQWREKRIAEGLCTYALQGCLGKARDGRTACEFCFRLRKSHNKQWREKRIAEGLCVYVRRGCLGKAKEHCVACESCFRLLSKSKSRQRNVEESMVVVPTTEAIGARIVRIVAKVSGGERKRLRLVALERGVELQELILAAIEAQYPGILDKGNSRSAS